MLSYLFKNRLPKGVFNLKQSTKLDDITQNAPTRSSVQILVQGGKHPNSPPCRLKSTTFERNVPRRKGFCSNFISFNPMELIFTEWIGDIWEFFWYSEILNWNLQTEYFDKNVNFQLFKKCCFGGVMSKIDFEQNWRYGYVLYYGFGVK